MAKEHEIVDFINSELTTNQFSSKRFQTGSVRGIAELVTTEEETKPAIVDRYGDCTYVGLDDTYSFQLYHRVIQPTAELNIEEEFGDRKNIKENTEMLMVVMGDRNRLQLTAEDIKTGIVAALPLELPVSELNSLGLRSANIIPGSFNWNRQEVYEGEFKLEETLLKTNTIMFSFTYTIETVFDQACFTLCE
jgi:hypothetical protein